MMVIKGVDPQLFKTLAALGDYVQDIVLVGGWVTHIYALIWPSEQRILERRTFDVDAAVRGRLPVRGQSRLDSRLDAQGYIVRLGGMSGPAAQRFENLENEDLLDIEFLFPLTGPSEHQTVEIQTGVVAQALRYLNVLLDSVMEVYASGELPGGDVVTIPIRVPTPSAFIYHRGLAFVERTDRRMRAKDLYYIFETWMNYPDRRDDIVREIDQLRWRYPRKWYGRFRANLGRLFSSDIAEGVLLVAQQYSTDEPEELVHRRIYRAFESLLRAIPTE